MRHASGVKIVTIALCASLSALALGGLAGCGHDKLPSVQVTDAAPTPPPSGLIQGRLLAVGGPEPGKPRPLAGKITFAGPGGSIATTTVDADGAFAIELSPGSYVVTGTSPAYEGSKATCHTTKPTTVITANGSTSADVYCQEA
jgi:hypothetical protein